MGIKLTIHVVVKVHLFHRNVFTFYTRFRSFAAIDKRKPRIFSVHSSTVIYMECTEKHIIFLLKKYLYASLVASGPLHSRGGTSKKIG